MKRFKRVIFLAVTTAFLFGCSQTNGEISSNSSSIEQSSLNESKFLNESSVNSIESISSSYKSSSSSKVSSLTTSSSKQGTTGALRLENNNGMVIDFATKGARISTIKLDGKSIGQNGFIAGRVANRIAGGSFELNGKTYTLSKNDGNNTLHGGPKGFGEIDWNVGEITANSISFTLHSADGDMGFPGNMDVTTKYTLTDSGELSYEISAVCDKDTIFNPINHLYMNLNGSTNVSDHTLWIDADKYLSSDSSKIPTGELKDVTNRSSINYTTKKDYEKGNDRCLVLNGEGYRKVAELQGKTTGYKMELYTDRVALQLYDDGQRICLESQDYVDAIHHENFPSIVLKANEQWYSKSAYCFSK